MVLSNSGLQDDALVYSDNPRPFRKPLCLLSHTYYHVQ